MATYYFSAFADEASSNFDEQLAALRRNRIRFLEIRGVNKCNVESLADCTLKEIKKKMDEAGIQLSALGSKLGKTDITKPFAPSLENLKRACEVCHLLGTDRIRIFSYFIPEGEERAPYREEVLERLGKLCDYAETQGIHLFHENESRIYGQNPAEVLEIIKAEPRLGKIYDPSNFVMEDADIDFCRKEILPFTDYLHIKDCTKEHEIVPPGAGDGKIAETVADHSALHDGPSFLTMEPHLFKFNGYSDIDKHELKNKYHFENSNASFDYAVSEMKKILTELGFKEQENLGWKK